MPVVLSDYEPPPYLAGGHAQTLYAALVRTVAFEYDRRERIATWDGDFLDLEWAARRTNGYAEASRVAVLTHGLEGSAQGTYIRGMAQMLTRRGWDVLAWNLRGCSAEPNRALRTYHSGATEDLDAVVQHAFSRGYETVALVGFSLGGNLTLKYVGERGAGLNARIRASVAFSVPVDLSASADEIAKITNWHYSQHFLRSLRAKIKAKARQHPGALDAGRLRDVWHIRDFDEHYTAPLNGFEGAEDYYRRASCKSFLPGIRIPTLLVNAANDPFLARACYPVDIARTHPYLTFEAPADGGHVGFVLTNGSGTSDVKGAYWSEQRAAAFLDDALRRSGR